MKRLKGLNSCIYTRNDTPFPFFIQHQMRAHTRAQHRETGNGCRRFNKYTLLCHSKHTRTWTTTIRLYKKPDDLPKAETTTRDSVRLPPRSSARQNHQINKHLRHRDMTIFLVISWSVQSRFLKCFQRPCPFLPSFFPANFNDAMQLRVTTANTLVRVLRTSTQYTHFFPHRIVHFCRWKCNRSRFEILVR